MRLYAKRQAAAISVVGEREVDEGFFNRFTELKSRLKEESRDVQKSETHSKDPAARAEALNRRRRCFITRHGWGGVCEVDEAGVSDGDAGGERDRVCEQL